MSVPWDPRNPAGGVSTMVRTLSRHLSELGIASSALVPEWGARSIRQIADEEMALFVRRFRAPSSRPFDLRAYLGWSLSRRRSVQELAQFIEEQEIGLVHVHFASPYQHHFRLLQEAAGIPYVVTLHRGDVLNFHRLRPSQRKLVNELLDDAAVVVAVSDSLREEARGTLGRSLDIQVIPNGVELPNRDDECGSVSSDEGPDFGGEFCLMVANVTHYKAPDIAIEAWRRVALARPGTKLLVIGEPREQWDACLAAVRRFGLGDVVHLLGSRSHGFTLKAIQRCKVFLFPSRSEGLPYALLEAGAFGKPVVTSDIGPFLEVVQADTSGLVVPVDDPDALARAVLCLLDDDARRIQLGRALNAVVHQRFSAGAMAEAYASLYRGILAT